MEERLGEGFLIRIHSIDQNLVSGIEIDDGLGRHDSTISRRPSANHETALRRRQCAIIGDVHVGSRLHLVRISCPRRHVLYFASANRTNVQDNCVLHTRTARSRPFSKKKHDWPQRDAPWLLRGEKIFDWNRVEIVWTMCGLVRSLLSLPVLESHPDDHSAAKSL
jgi:hypothetical protein